MIKPYCIHTEGKYHDCDYVDAVNSFIDRASDAANRKVGKAPKPGHDKSKWADEWDKIYFQNLKVLTKDIRREFSERGKIN